MHINDIYSSKRPQFSFEFFPPKSEEAAKKLYNTIKDLVPLGPAYVSVTYGAGGSTRQLTHDLVMKIQKETNITVIPHLTCIYHTKDEIYKIIDDYQSSGIQNILALRGDPPQDNMKFEPIKHGFNYTSELVAFIKRNFPKIGIGVAGYPEGHPDTPNRLQEIDFLKKKIDLGADYICSQLFFDNRDFFDFKERCELANINVPIVAGIMPITSRKDMAQIADLALGTRYPAKMIRALYRAEDAKHSEAVGIHWATQQVQDLIDNGVKGIHLYTLNKSKATLKIYESQGISRSDRLALGIRGITTGMF